MNLHKLARYVVLTGIFIVPFIPLIVANSLFFPFITGKNFAFRIIVEIIFGAWIILALTDKTYRPQKSWILWALSAFVVIIGIADIFGVYPYKSLWSNYERMEGFVALVHLGIYTLIAATVLNTARLWTWFWNTSIGVSVIVGFHGLFQLAGWITINQGGVRLDARFGNATYLAVYMLFHIFITAYLMTSRTMFLATPYDARIRKNKIIIGSAIIVLQVINIYYTATRGAILGLIGGILLSSLLIVLFEKKRPRVKKISLGILITTFIVVVGFLGIKNTSFVRESPVLNRFATISLSDNTTKSRFILWGMALEGFKERPLLGWGQENFNYVFNKYYDPVLYNQEQWFDRTHNVIFDWLIAGGILGLLAYLSLYVVVLLYIWKKTNGFGVTEKSLLTGLLAGYFIHNLFVFDNLTSYILFFSVVAFVYFHTTSHAEHKKNIIQENRIVAPVVLVALILILYVVNIKPMQASSNLIAALTPQQNGTITKNLEYFKKAINYNTFGSPEIREHLFSSVQQVLAAQNALPGAEELAQFAVEQGNIQISRTPLDARYQLLYGSFLNSIGQYDKALTHLQKALELSPQKQSIMYEIASLYAARQDFVNSSLYFKKAYELEPQNKQARIYYAASSIYEGKTDQALELLKGVDENSIINSDHILYAYYNTKKYQQVIPLLKARVAVDPKNIQLHYFLAVIYSLVNDKANAIAEIREVIRLEPKFTEQGEQYIRQIQSGKPLQ